MADAHILLLLSDFELGDMLVRTALAPAGYRVSRAETRADALMLLDENPADVIILSEKIEDTESSEFVTELSETHPLLPVILVIEPGSSVNIFQTIRQGYTDCLQAPFHPKDVQSAVESAIERAKRIQRMIRIEAKRDTNSLRNRVNGLEIIQRVGRRVTALLNLDEVLATVVGAAVDLTEAEYGSLLLLDEDTGELHLRAGRNFQDELAQTLRIPVKDSLVSQVLRSGKPLLINEKPSQKIKNKLLVYPLLYVPIIMKDRVIGVLEVHNQHTQTPFSEYHSLLVSALADYAAIAIENANLYSRTEIERYKLETILTNIEEGVIIVDKDFRLVLINRKARDTFQVDEKQIAGKRIREVILNQEILDIFEIPMRTEPSRTEITLEDGRVLNAQLTPIPEIGLVLTMQEITHLKELDRIKSDFVNTVSHDLRSPLTAILGYVELLERVGPINEQQKEFIRRVQVSVYNITSLINDLLDLGRIEAGFDSRNEIVPIAAIIEYAVAGLVNRAQHKSQNLYLEIKEELPQVLGNPIRLRQMMNNLISNSINYTNDGGFIKVISRSEENQVIIEIQDNGPGIPPSDQPYIFDKFFRAGNVPYDSPGTGLGLAIVKSIVDSHMGRIWVDSTLNEGTTFTVVLPIADREL